MREAHRLLRRAVLLGPLLIVLAACVSIPDTGSVTTRTAEAHGQRPQGYIRAVAQKASPGMKPDEIAAGFLLAQVDPDLKAARTYLTPEEAGRWTPQNAPVTIFANETPPTFGKFANGAVKFTAQEDGVISAGGDFTATPLGKVAGSLQMTRVDGEWRISNAPDGLYLSPNDFTRNYAVYDTYFLAPGSTRLVPNPVYLPLGTSQSTALVQALLAGPGPWLAPSVRTAFPKGTKLSLPSAPIRDNIVQVDLTQQVALASSADLKALAAQLAWTLGQLEDVKAVRLTTNHVSLGGIGDTIDKTDYGSYDPSGGAVGPAVAIVNGQLSTLGKTAVPLPGAIGGGEVLLAHPGISVDGRRAAALNTASTQLYVGAVRENGPMKVRLTAKKLITPSFDSVGDVWTAGVSRAKQTTIWVLPPGAGPAREVNTPELTDGELFGWQVLSLRIARDGVRVAVVLQPPLPPAKVTKAPKAGAKVVPQTPLPGQLFLGHIERSGDAITLDGLHRVESVLGNVAEVSWASADNILVLDNSTHAPYFVEPFGAVVPVGGTPLNGTILQVTAAPQQVILASTKAGKIWSSDGTQWTVLRTGKDPAYPG
jgi:Lipoprotein LpqB beta-propeller domain/Sporulation and spore germination